MKVALSFLGALLLGGMMIWPLSSFAGSVDFIVEEGQIAPDFTLLDQNGNPIKLSSQQGLWVVLYFYPKDDTPGCTKEACSFRDNLVAIQQLDAVVLGVSVDSVSSHKAFADKYDLNFSILADEQHTVCRNYGTLTRFMGRKIARRSTVIIDPEGIIRKLFRSVRPTDHALEIYKALQELKRL